MTPDEVTIRDYEHLRQLDWDLDVLFSKLSGLQLYVAANYISAAGGQVLDRRQELHPGYIEARNRTAKQ